MLDSHMASLLEINSYSKGITDIEVWCVFFFKSAKNDCFA